MKKIFFLIAILLLINTTIFASGSKEKKVNSTTNVFVSAQEIKDAKVTLQLWHAQTSLNEEALNAVVALFNTTNKYDITVKASSQNGYSECNKKVMAALAAKSQPNIAQAYNNNVLDYLPSEKVLNLTDYLNDDFGLSIEDKATIVPSYLAENEAYPDGQSYTTSLGKSTEVLYYNKTFFKQNNLKVPTTYQELSIVAKKASAILGKPAFGYESIKNLSIYGPQNFGAKYATPDGTVLLFNKENLAATMACYQWWQKGINEGYFSIAGEDKYCAIPFCAGRSVMFVGSCSVVSYLIADGFEIGVAPIPFGKNPTVIQEGGNFCGFKSGNPIVDLATSIFLEFLYTPEASALYAVKTGYAPSNEMAKKEQIYKDFLAENNLKTQTKEISANYPAEYRGFDPIFSNSYITRVELGKIIETISLDKNISISDEIKNISQRLNIEYAQ
jgi:multiple sugar transport system substrate-binding protein